MQQPDIQKLLNKYLSGTCTQKEQGLLETWYLKQKGQDLPTISQFKKNKQLDEVWKSLPIHEEKIHKINYWPRIVAAASIILCFSFGGYFLLHERPEPKVARNKPYDIAPGRNQATLTLANGQKILLTKGLNGKLAQQGNSVVQVNSGNAIAYTVNSGNPADRKVEYNTLSTKNGEQSPYPLVLSDGSKVWLNAGSSVTFPTAFYGKDRMISITGEAYLEVVHNAVKPFQVSVKDQIIQDIGTHFNINAYDDEKVIKTTLLEGSVKVSKNNLSVILKPGEQSQIRASSPNIKIIRDANIEETIAWKNGYFRFKDEKIESVMRKLARWYDVDVQYQGPVSNEEYNGTIARIKNISQVLKMLGATNTVQFKVEGRRVILTNK
jgi:transmembrane sensor